MPLIQTLYGSRLLSSAECGQPNEIRGIGVAYDRVRADFDPGMCCQLGRSMCNTQA
jgi:hypothetical protein